jgi:hypothetical protein
MLGDTRSSPHLSVVALGCLDVRDERGEQSRYWTAQSITWRASTKDKCYSQRPKKGMTSKTYRCQGDGETLLVEWGPLLDSREVQGFLTREHTRGQWSTEQDSVLGIKSGLRDTDVCSRVYI